MRRSRSTHYTLAALLSCAPLASGETQQRNLVGSGFSTVPESSSTHAADAPPIPSRWSAQTPARGSRWKEELLIGAAAGAAIMVVNVLVTCDPMCGDEHWGELVLPVTVVGAAGGGLLGAVMGAFIRQHDSSADGTVARGILP